MLPNINISEDSLKIGSNLWVTLISFFAKCFVESSPYLYSIYLLIKIINLSVSKTMMFLKEINCLVV